jgi:hypothetical protein
MFAGGSALAAVQRAAGPQADVVMATKGEVEQLAASGNVVAAVTADVPRTDDQIVVWKAPGPRAASIDSQVDSSCVVGGVDYGHAICGNAPSAGEDVQQLAVGNDMVAWITALTSDDLEQLVYRASLAGGTVSKLGLAENGNGAGGDASGAYFGNLYGSGALLAYNSWNVCGDFGTPCPTGVTYADERLLTLAGTTSTTVLDGTGAVALVAVGGGRMAIDSIDSPGPIAIVSASGAPISTVATVPGNAPRTVALTATAVVVERSTTLDVDDPTTGAIVRSIPLGAYAAASLVGAGGSLALLIDHHLHSLILIDLTTGEPLVFPLPAAATTAKNPAAAAIDGTGLFYAYNVAGSADKGRIAFEPMAKLLRRF